MCQKNSSQLDWWTQWLNTLSRSDYRSFQMENSINSKIKNSFSIENILAKKPIVQHKEDCEFVDNNNSDRDLFKRKISACDEDYRLDKSFSMPDSSCTEDTNEICSDEASEESNCTSIYKDSMNIQALQWVSY